MRISIGLSVVLIGVGAVAATPAVAGSQSAVDPGSPGGRALAFFAGPEAHEPDALLRRLRPAPISPAVRAAVVAALPREGELQPTEAERAKIAALAPVFDLHERNGLIVIKVIDVGHAFVGLHAKAVLLLSRRAVARERAGAPGSGGTRARPRDVLGPVRGRPRRRWREAAAGAGASLRRRRGDDAAWAWPWAAEPHRRGDEDDPPQRAARRRSQRPEVRVPAATAALHRGRGDDPRREGTGGPRAAHAVADTAPEPTEPTWRASESGSRRRHLIPEPHSAQNGHLVCDDAARLLSILRTQLESRSEE